MVVIRDPDGRIGGRGPERFCFFRPVPEGFLADGGRVAVLDAK